MNSGFIRLDNGYVISDTLSRSEFTRSTLGATAKINVENGDLLSYRTSIQQFQEKEFTITLFFEGERLYRVHLYLHSTWRGSGWSTNNWNREIQIKNEQDSFLKDLLGNPPYKYNWGEIQSISDKKSGFSEITISYTKNL